MQWVARTMAAAPAAVMPLRVGSPAVLVVAYAALATGVAAVARVARAASRRLGPPRPRRRVGWAAATAAALAVTALLAAASPAHDARPPLAGEVVVSFLDIGQGDATLVQSGSANAPRHRAARWPDPARGSARPASGGSTGSCSRTRSPTTRAWRSR